MTEPNAKVILDSISPEGHRLTTLEVTMHRFVLAEFNTHRVFSRNSASSRAIPFAKQLERVQYDPAIPVSFPAEQRGMQGGDEVEDRWEAEEQWLLAREAAIAHATKLSELGVHKSVVNRLLEPFLWHTVIVTSTEWDNFFGLRYHTDAQPEIYAAAKAMYEAYSSVSPRERDWNEWHMPYLTEDDFENSDGYDLREISAARCARVSYLTHDGVRDLSKDKELYDRLTSAYPMHSSPLEHVATPGLGTGNFEGWTQFRHMVEADNG